MTIVALTSIPPRFPDLAGRLKRILAQAPERVCLTLPRTYRRFPDWSGQIPALPSGVDILRAADCGPATKFLAVFRRYAHADVLIADDDCDYGSGWLAGFEIARRRNSAAAIAASCFDTERLGLPGGHRIVQGFAGVLLRPDILDPAVLVPGDPAFWVDDIWLSAHLAHAGVEIIDCAAARAAVTPVTAPDQMQKTKTGGRTRADLNRLVAHDLHKRLGIWQ